MDIGSECRTTYIFLRSHAQTDTQTPSSYANVIMKHNDVITLGIRTKNQITRNVWSYHWTRQLSCLCRRKDGRHHRRRQVQVLTQPREIFTQVQLERKIMVNVELCSLEMHFLSVVLATCSRVQRRHGLRACEVFLLFLSTHSCFQVTSIQSFRSVRSMA